MAPPFVYDLFDRRIARKVDADGNGVFETTQQFVYDGEDLILAFSGPNNALTNRYLYGPATDEILADEQLSTTTTGTAGTVTWSLGDNLGTIRDLVQYTAATGTTSVVNHVRYDTFGQIVSQTNSQFQPWFAYTGREWDPRYCQELCSEECGSGGVSELENSVGEDLPFEEGEDQGGGIEFAPVPGR